MQQDNMQRNADSIRFAKLAELSGQKDYQEYLQSLKDEIYPHKCTRESQ